MNLITLFSFSVYLLLMLGIGLYFYLRTKNLSDYILGGRNLNAWVTSLSAQASDMSGWLLLGLPGYAYLSGLESIWLLIGLTIGTYANWKFVAVRLRKLTSKLNDSLTIPDYFQNRFKSKSNILRVTSSLFILIFFLIYTSSGFVAGAKLFSSVFNLSYFNALLIGSFVIVSYTFLGGFLAVSWTDVVQGIMMFFAVIIVPIIGININGGFQNTVYKITENNSELLNLLTYKSGEMISIITILSLLGWGLGYFGQPHILARFMAIKNISDIKIARKIAMIWVIICLISAVILGIVGSTLFTLDFLGNDSERIFITMVNELVNPIFAGVLLSAILAAVMSTADSQLLVVSSSLTEDIYKPFFRPNASQKELIWVSRLFVVIVAIFAIIIGLDPQSSVLNLVAYAWAGFGATFGPIIIVSLYWKKINEWGAITGIISGGITVIIWKNLSGGIFELYEIIPGFLISIICIYLISIISYKENDEFLLDFKNIEN